MGKDRDLLVMGSVDAHEPQLIELGFRRVGAHTFRAQLTEGMLNMAAWRKAFPSIAKVKVHTNDTFTDSAKPMPEALRGESPKVQTATPQVSTPSPSTAQVATPDIHSVESSGLTALEAAPEPEQGLTVLEPRPQNALEAAIWRPEPEPEPEPPTSRRMTR